MLDIVAQAIDRFYIQKNYNAFKEACHKKMSLPKELKSYIDFKNLPTEESIDKNWPSKEFGIQFDSYEKGEFRVSYRTSIQISKVASLFYIEHTFEVDNKDENSMTLYLDGSSNMAYTKAQFDLEEKIHSILSQIGYHPLAYRDMYEVVEGFKMPEGVTIFGPQITIELLLFRDIYNICGK